MHWMNIQNEGHRSSKTRVQMGTAEVWASQHTRKSLRRKGTSNPDCHQKPPAAFLIASTWKAG